MGLHALSVSVLRVPTPPGKSGIFVKFPRSGKSWKFKLKVLEKSWNLLGCRRNDADVNMKIFTPAHL